MVPVILCISIVTLIVAIFVYATLFTRILELKSALTDQRTAIENFREALKGSYNQCEGISKELDEYRKKNIDFAGALENYQDKLRVLRENFQESERKIQAKIAANKRWSREEKPEKEEEEEVLPGIPVQQQDLYGAELPVVDSVTGQPVARRKFGQLPQPL